jgi:hypothetical protein
MKKLNSESPSEKQSLLAACGTPTATRHHLDPRAGLIVHEAPAGDDDTLIDTVSTARWLGVSTQFLELGRCKGYGPDFIRLSARCVRYRKGAVLTWLKSREIAA